MGFEKEFDSKEEYWFDLYVKELVDHGWLKSVVYQPKSFVLAEDYITNAFIEGKKENKLANVKLARGAVYTADFKLVWNKKAKGKYCWVDMGVYLKGFYPYSKPNKDKFIPFYARTYETDLVSYVDVKGNFGNAHGLAKFSITQKWLLERDVFIQKVVITLDEKGLFARSFTPRVITANEVYQKNCKYGQAGDSKLKYSPTLIEKWK